jgi:hypothetical protein
MFVALVILLLVAGAAATYADIVADIVEVDGFGLVGIGWTLMIGGSALLVAAIQGTGQMPSWRTTGDRRRSSDGRLVVVETPA